MTNVLVAYATNAGSTAKVAQVIGEELSQAGVQAQVLRLDQVTHLDGYDAVVVGAPMIMGWHDAAVKFVKQHQLTLSRVPVAYFLTAMSLTQTNEANVNSIPIYVDPALAKPPKNVKRPNLKERYATVTRYLRPVLDAAPSVRPVSVGLFGGKLELYRLPLWQMLFVLLVIQAQPGDFRNWPAVREWAIRLRSELFESKLARMKEES
jgi:menaquinone-dependent protoporphyrinogen IX oxidase